MDWKDVAGVVSKAAPIVGGILGGPAGAAVGGLVATALGTQATPDAVSAALLADPQAALKLKELEVNSKVQLQQLAVTAEQNRLQASTAQYAAEAADRDSARKLAAQQHNDWVRPAITAMLLLGAVGIVFCVFSGIAERLLRDTTASLTIGTVIGYWFNELKQTLSFWFGTTGEAQRSSAEVLQFAVSPGSVTAPGEKP
ncbi:MAG: hypothetical protein LBH31_01590 [Burkholderiaceae bacterium]|jgi:hypothetical protein|nr:hypothetical protein [Burkholderiaceae bacterium]